MNKNIFKAALLAAFALPVLSSCELDQEPETNITYESSWGESEDPYEDACKHYTGMMTVVRAVVGGSNASSTSVPVPSPSTRSTAGPLPPTSLPETSFGPTTSPS